jgi:hypothetical protein
MNVTILDNRSLALAVINPAADLFYVWSSGVFSAPFSSAAHLKPLVPVEAPPSLLQYVQTCNIGNVLEQQGPAVVLLTWTVDGSGNAIAVVDCWPMPFPIPIPVAGGWTLG